MKMEKEIVKEVVLKAGAFVKERFGNANSVDFKGDIDLVTDVDRGSEEMIKEEVERTFPDDDILAEESGTIQRNLTSRKWLIDPLDGTTNFTHGYPCVSISIALEEAGEIILGVVHDPISGEYFEAEKGKGATLNGEIIRVSRTRTTGESLIATGFPYDIREFPEGHMETLERILMATQGIRRDGSAAIDLCHVACGRLDGFYERKLAPWDTAAGILIVREAGGKVTSFSEDRYSIHDKEILASNGVIHGDLSEILTG